MGCGCPLPRGFSGNCMTWLSFVSFFLFFLAANAFVALCDWIFLCCAETLISSLDQYKQRKHGVWEEGTRGGHEHRNSG